MLSSVYVRQHLSLEVLGNALLERYALRISQVRVGLGVAVPIAADLGRLIALAQRTEYRLQLGRGESHIDGPVDLPQFAYESLSILVELCAVLPGKRAEELANVLLPALANLNLFEPCLLVLLAAGREFGESGHLAVFVALVGPPEQVADAPDEARELGMGFGVHALLTFSAHVGTGDASLIGSTRAPHSCRTGVDLSGV